MPKPYICVACDKVIVEQPLPGAPPGGEVVSLISLFNKVVAVIQGGDISQIKIPTNAVYPKEWAIYSSWDVEPGDEKRNYMICTQMYYPDHSPFGPVSKNALKMKENERAQNILRIMGFPIGQRGMYTIETWLEENEKKVFGPIEFKVGLEIKNPESLQQAENA
jgi:hypothetical protein